MERREIKLGWNATGILGMVFAPIGFVFLALGILLWYFKAGKTPEDQVVLLAVLGGEGLVFLLTGLGLLWADVRRRNAARRAVDFGTVVMADVSGSMSGRPMATSVGLSIYFAEHNKGPFTNRFIRLT